VVLKVVVAERSDLGFGGLKSLVEEAESREELHWKPELGC